MRCPAHEVRYSQPIGPTPLAPQRAEPVTPRRAAPSLPVTATSLLSAAHVQLAGVAMIRDVTEFRRTGVASRRVAELDIPVAAWRAAMCHASTRRPRGRRTTIRRRRAAGRARDVRAARGACGSSLRQPWTTGGPHAAVDHWRTARSRGPLADRTQPVDVHADEEDDELALDVGGHSSAEQSALGLFIGCLLLGTARVSW